MKRLPVIEPNEDPMARLKQNPKSRLSSKFKVQSSRFNVPDAEVWSPGFSRWGIRLSKMARKIGTFSTMRKRNRLKPGLHTSDGSARMMVVVTEYAPRTRRTPQQ